MPKRNKFIVESFVNKASISSYDDAGIEELRTNRKIFYFSIEDGIRNKILCPFDYIPLKYTPSKEELKEKRRVFNSWKYLADEGLASPESPYIMASNVIL